MDVETVRALSTGEGKALLEALPDYDEQRAMAMAQRLRAAGFDPGLLSAALHQSRLRARAVDKLGEFAGRMLFTDDGLEQATRLAVAARHAQRYARAGARLVQDLGCGIGVDSLAFAGIGLAVRAVDADPVTAAVAAHNLAPFPDARVECASAQSVLQQLERATTDHSPQQPGSVARGHGEALAHTGLWFDPARRESGARHADGRPRRVFSLEAISPSWDTVLDAAAAHPMTGAKLSPGFPHGALPPGAEAQWVSWLGEVVECSVWFGPLVTHAGRTAAVCRDGRTDVITQADAAGAPEPGPGAGGLGPWLHDPDRAVVRAGLVGALARAVDGREVASGAGYVTTSSPTRVPWAHRYVVREVMPWNVKAVRTWLRGNDIERVTIKNRASGLDPALVRRQLRVTDGAQATLVLTRVGASAHVLVVDPG